MTTLASRQLGPVIAMQGSTITVELMPGNNQGDKRATVGTFVGVHAGNDYLVGNVSRLTAERGGPARAEITLLGQFALNKDSSFAFHRGARYYPAIGDNVEFLPNEHLKQIYQDPTRASSAIGWLCQDSKVPVYLDVNDLLFKHFAVLGTTGVGKSSAVALIIDRALQARNDIRVFLIDVHSEYTKCFSGRVHTITPHSLKLPFWLFSLEEITDVIYSGRSPADEEVEVLAEAIAYAKNKYASYKDAGDRASVRRSATRFSEYTVDTPVPYLLQDLIANIDDRMGRLENRALRLVHHRLIARIEAIRNNPRYAFMFENANVGGDVMSELITSLFRLTHEDQPITLMQLAGLPTEVVDAVVSVLCRLAFEFGVWSDGAVPLLFVCEEAHRYAAADKSIGFTPIRRALSRIAKEGRKYGVTLALVTQRPAEIDPAIISQCSTLFAMRMLNDRDQEFMACAVADAPHLLEYIPLLGTREVAVFGEGVSFPALMRFEKLPVGSVPRSDSGVRGTAALRSTVGSDFVDSVVERWRGATMSREGHAAERATGLANQSSHPPQNTSVSDALDKVHQRILNRPVRPAVPELSKR